MKPKRIISATRRWEFAEDYLTLLRTIFEMFFQVFCYETHRFIQKRWESAKVSFLRSQIKRCHFFEMLFKALY